jgi:hypothetical protein
MLNFNLHLFRFVISTFILNNKNISGDDVPNIVGEDNCVIVSNLLSKLIGRIHVNNEKIFYFEISEDESKALISYFYSGKVENKTIHDVENEYIIKLLLE